MIATRDLIKKTRLKPGREFFESSVLRENASAEQSDVVAQEGQFVVSEAASETPLKNEDPAPELDHNEPKI